MRPVLELIYGCGESTQPIRFHTHALKAGADLGKISDTLTYTESDASGPPERGGNVGIPAYAWDP